MTHKLFKKSELWLVLNYLRDQRDNISSNRDVEVAGFETLTVVRRRDVVGFDEEEGRDSVAVKGRVSLPRCLDGDMTWTWV